MKLMCKKFLTLVLLGLHFACITKSSANTSLQTFTSKEFGFSISYPSDWVPTTPLINEVWIAKAVTGPKASCFVRISTVPDLQYVSVDKFLAAQTEEASLKLLAIGFQKPEMHVFDIAYMDKHKARRIIYSGIDEGISTTSYVLQTIVNNDVYTATCVSERKNFLLVFSQLDTILNSYKFLEASGVLKKGVGPTDPTQAPKVVMDENLMAEAEQHGVTRGIIIGLGSMLVISGAVLPYYIAKRYAKWWQTVLSVLAGIVAAFSMAIVYVLIIDWFYPGQDIIIIILLKSVVFAVWSIVIAPVAAFFGIKARKKTKSIAS